MRTQLLGSLRLGSLRLGWKPAGSLAAVLLVMGGTVYWELWSPPHQAEASAFADAGTLARLERLEAEAARVSRLLGVEPTAGVILAQSGSMPEGYAAQVEVRLSQLEAQMRQLTGRIEQAQYDAQQLSDQLRRSMQDIEFRLDMLEGGSSGSGGPLGPISGGPAPAAAGAAPPASSDIGPTYDSLSELATQPSPTGGTLGTLTVPGGDQGTSVASLEDAQGQYETAYQLLQRADYPGAEAALQQFLSAYPSHELASNAQYWLGETYYVRGRYNDAAIAFAQSYQRYPGGAKAVDSLLKLGMSLAALGQRDDACITFAQLRTEFPNAPAAIINRADQESDQLECQ